jgi:hypothetical protein
MCQLKSRAGRERASPERPRRSPDSRKYCCRLAGSSTNA